MEDLKLNLDIAQDLVCPVCKTGGMSLNDSTYHCANPACAVTHPVIDGCPILINEANSVFAIEDFQSRGLTTMGQHDDAPEAKTAAELAKDWLRRRIPSTSRSVNDFPLSNALKEIHTQLGGTPNILIIGAGDAEIELPGGGQPVYTDVANRPLTQLICDAHDIPFPNEYFDAVIAISVLEHVADPYRCSDEIHRVLKSEGFVYAITPFMQQVHMGRYDFTRFTHLGHRRLFRRFTEQRSGVANAQGMALAWSLERFIAGFGGKKATYSKLRSLARFIAFPFVAFDHVLARKASAYDAASAFYFFGRKSDQTLSDRKLIQGYRGMA